MRQTKVENQRHHILQFLQFLLSFLPRIHPTRTTRSIFPIPAVTDPVTLGICPSTAAVARKVETARFGSIQGHQNIDFALPNGYSAAPGGLLLRSTRVAGAGLHLHPISSSSRLPPTVPDAFVPPRSTPSSSPLLSSPSPAPSTPLPSTQGVRLRAQTVSDLLVITTSHLVAG
ncbi:hypothetical protein BO70DRAFT_105400 [Aspergillus heteromorphus CBS 117.55]|uniref:Uncharacterized protein n=1 Tax=Aspergillus heteromorphus CBS 117.55 TaxID=1448321 RepID=A0A317VMR6_9EURO|nr:uncharacterized protein BO70DRAFT_105400 [Aspergillus heteromorphus CBS 117.55]PWY74377.1 hypothetical protein BO70DRAFT_105400 [Aspergillus heteromorphus CBS 117.55]